MKLNNSISHVIFDFDGTLVGTQKYYIEVTKQFSQKYGKQISSQTLNLLYNSSNSQEFGQRLCDGLEIETSKWKIVSHHYFEFDIEYKLELKQGVDRLVRHLRNNGIHMAIATKNYQILVNRVLKKFGDYFQPNNNFSHIVCGTDNPEITYNKPNPEIYINCIKKFEIQPNSLENVLIIEDDLVCAKSAVKCGMKSVLVNQLVDISNDSEYQELSVIKSLNDFKPKNFGLPDFD